jgi:hypothetical protein
LSGEPYPDIFFEQRRLRFDDLRQNGIPVSIQKFVPIHWKLQPVWRFFFATIGFLRLETNVRRVILRL